MGGGDGMPCDTVEVPVVYLSEVSSASSLSGMVNDPVCVVGTLSELVEVSVSPDSLLSVTDSGIADG